ncbi:hypothetical protein K466DRAFT_449151, partial [Polyporus arcularius HHB13444]
PHLSETLKERIIEWRHAQDMSAREIALLAGCSERTIYTVLRNHREYNQTSNPHARPAGRPRVLDQADLTYISSLIHANPTIYLDEIQEQLSEVRKTE